MYADADGDGWSNYAEWLADSNPLNPVDFPAPGTISNSITTVIAPGTNALPALAQVPIRITNAVGNMSTPFLQYSNASTMNWSNVTIAQVDGTNYSISLRVAALPTGSDHTVIWNAVHDLGLVRTNVMLRAMATDVAFSGDWSDPVAFMVDTIDSTSTGIPDWWSVQHFGYVGVDPNADPDHDGLNNWQEYVADTDPLDPNSKLQITGVSFVSGGVKIDWRGGTWATQVLQRSTGLGGTNDWSNIFTALPPTSVSGSHTDAVSTNVMNFYRVQVSR